MAHKAKKTEHAGSKKARGAYYGRKRDAKRESSRTRRRDARKFANADARGDPFLTIGTRATPSPTGPTEHADIDSIVSLDP